MNGKFHFVQIHYFSAMKWFLFLSLVIAVLLYGCSTEVELNAPYKSTTVIFGLIDPDPNQDGLYNALDTQWVKINKTYLANDNLSTAAIRDSSEYDFSEFAQQGLKVIQHNPDQSTQTFYLQEKEINNKSMNGIFYGPEQLVYYFTPAATGINMDATYEIVVDFVTRQDVNATTNVVKNNNVTFVFPQANGPLLLASQNVNGTVNYTQPTIKWTKAANVVYYDVNLRFHYTERPIEESSGGIAKVIDYYVGNVTLDDINGSNADIKMSGESFFSYVGNSVPTDASLERVIGFYDSGSLQTRCFDILVAMANDEFKTYIDVNSPITGIVQERPTYTNVNNGLGLFASRSTAVLKNVLAAPLPNGGGNPNMGNFFAFANSTYTVDKNFCDSNTGSSYSCGN
jgi:hypothetical protein